MLKTVVLVILDGFGIAPPSRGNSITLAKTPEINSMLREYPAGTLHASGEMVGLPWAEMGNSEVGHITIGSGRIVHQSLPMINRSIAEGSFFENERFLQAIAHCKKNNSALHFIGLCSDGGVHSSLGHLFALLRLAKSQNLEKVYIHAVLDGRDTQHNAGLKNILSLTEQIKQIGVGKIISLSGRFYAMDRDNHWERIKLAYEIMTASQGKEQDPIDAIETSYRRGIFDEEFMPIRISDQGAVKEGDAVIFFNFRADRARQITKAFTLPSFVKFERNYIKDLFFTTMVEYEKNLPVHVAFLPETVKKPLAKIISEANLKQLHIAETEKYAHVTFFFNGGVEEAFPGEERIIVPSPQVNSYAERPEMSINELCQRVMTKINENVYSFIVVNIANADMVGHSGNLPATIKAIEAIDRQLGLLKKTVLENNYSMIITGDHGNAEELFDLRTGEIDKEHSTNPVPFILVDNVHQNQKFLWPRIEHDDLSQTQPIGILSDIAPTILGLLELPKPKEMTGHSLLR